MVQVELTDQEREVLIRTLKAVLSDLSVEIANTDSLDFRQGLKTRRDWLTSALEKLQAASASTASQTPT